MKKYIYSIILVSFVTLSGLLSSCENDDDKVNAPESLSGTAWLYDTGETTVTAEGVEVGVAIELDFTSTTKVDLNILVGGIKDNAFAISGLSVGTFSYTYSKPDVTVIINDETLKGRIDGNKLTIDGDIFIKED